MRPPSALTLVTALAKVADPGSPGEATLTPVGGGDSHRALCLRVRDKRWLVKWNQRDMLPAFEAEMLGLAALAEPASGLEIPTALTAGAKENHSWLILPWLELHPSGDSKALGRGLARLHKRSGPAHGAAKDNFIGLTPQRNGRCEDWCCFWWRQRMLPQLELACEGRSERWLEAHVADLKTLCEERLSHRPPASLLHGDLWGGNHGYLASGRPVLYDPAVYHGDRETDLAMMRLFGGFDPAVLKHYEAAWPLPPGAAGRIRLYQLYHLLNHLNLFGAGWSARVRETVLQLLGE